MALRGHLPSGGSIERASEEIDAFALGPPLDEVSVGWGVSVPALASELTLRVGYGFSSGASDDGLGREVRYSVRRFPVVAAWRATFFDSALRPMLGAELGYAWGRAQYGGAFSASSSSAAGFVARAVAGIEIAFSDRFGLRAFTNLQRMPTAVIPGAPDISGGSLGAGIALVLRLPRGDKDKEDSRDEPFRAFEPSAARPSRERAYELIRAADEAARRGDAIGAERLYREGFPGIPRDAETQRSLGVPVLISWAATLAKVGRSDDAVRLLRKALELSPNNAEVRAALGKLGLQAPIAPEENQQAPRARGPVLPFEDLN